MWDSVLGKVRWVTAGSISASGKAEAIFEIKVTPSGADLGKFANIIGQTSLIATDTVTMSSVTSIAASLTSDLPNDPAAKDKGVVIGE